MLGIGLKKKLSMIDNGSTVLWLLGLMGFIIVLAMYSKAMLQKLGLPSLIGFIGLGFGLQFINSRWTFLNLPTSEVFEVLANLGVVMLLFRVGLSANLEGLIKQLRRASRIWFWDVLVSASFGFMVSYWLLNYPLIPSLFVAVALSATSVGVAVNVWHEADKLHTKEGELLLDVAELDDVSAVILLALLMTLVPLFQNGQASNLVALSLLTAIIFLAKGALFAGLCYVFAHFVEQRLTRFFEKLERPPDPMLTVTGIGMMFAAFAGLLGFSVAIGAFFAGLVFSRDPTAVEMDGSYETLYDFFVPFFFIGIGLAIDPSALGMAAGVGTLLLMAAIIGKFMGAGVPSLVMLGKSSALVLGISMIPRAEIGLIIMQQGLSLGDWALPPELFSGMIIVSLGTCLLAPLALRPLLKTLLTKKEVMA